jgi:amidophosphoribosyltransferase
VCGIVGIVSKQNVNQTLYDALTILQHRGQDAAGMVTSELGRFRLRKANGMVRDVFQHVHMERLQGKIGIGHVRYPTAGTNSSAEAQPFYVNSPYGITLAHNGNLTNTEALAKLLFETDLRHLNTRSDSEVLLNIFAHELQRLGKHHPTPQDIFAAVAGVHGRCLGAYAVVAMISGYGLVAFRDPKGIRPLVIGVRHTELGDDYMVASESVCLSALGFELLRDLAPGEAVYITDQGQLYSQQCAQDPHLSPCLFEYVYLARPDSIMEGISVYKARLSMGEKLAEKIQREWAAHSIDVVIPIPDTSRTAALEMANHLGVPYREGFVKNRYIARTFIMPGQQQRKKSVRQKLNAIEMEFKNKHVLLVDDSIVRGTTCQQIIEMARDAGALSVSFASAAPPVRYPNVYGIDMPSADELIAHQRTEAQICQQIGADRLIYQDLTDLCAAVIAGRVTFAPMVIERFDCSVFDGDYVTGDIDADYLTRLHAKRNDVAKENSHQKTQVIELHNAL